MEAALTCQELNPLLNAPQGPWPASAETSPSGDVRQTEQDRDTGLPVGMSTQLAASANTTIKSTEIEEDLPFDEESGDEDNPSAIVNRGATRGQTDLVDVKVCRRKRCHHRGGHP